MQRFLLSLEVTFSQAEVLCLLHFPSPSLRKDLNLCSRLGLQRNEGTCCSPIQISALGAALCHTTATQHASFHITKAPELTLLPPPEQAISVSILQSARVP
jgi:hypothetical protein